jgi:hypothetical protein
MQELLRDVWLDGRPWSYRLQVWDTGRMNGLGSHNLLRYCFTRLDGKGNAGEIGRTVIFEGSDYGCPAVNSIDSDDMLRTLIGFLTLRPGDTDEDYFSRYTQAQLEWAASDDCEEIAQYAEEEDPLSFQDFEPSDD